MSKTKMIIDNEEEYEDAMYVRNEKVLCFHGPLIYEGKVLSVQLGSVAKPGEDGENDHFSYLIHYAGWSKKWDEVVPESRVLKYNDLNLSQQKELQKQQNAGGAKKRTKGSGAKVSSRNKKAKESSKVKGTESPEPSANSTMASESELDSTVEGNKNDLDSFEDMEQEAESTQADEPTGKVLEVAVADVSSTTKVVEEVELVGLDNPSGEDVEADEEVAQVEWDNENKAEADARPGSMDKKQLEILGKAGEHAPKLPVEELNENEFQDLLPPELIEAIARDYLRLHVEKMVIKIPARVSVDRILELFLIEIKNEKTEKEWFQFVEIIKGIKVNFEREMGKTLLYQTEQQSFNALMEKLKEDADVPIIQQSMSALFGITHLLRFCARFASVVNNNRGDEEINIELLKGFFVEFYASLLGKLDDYLSVTEDYVAQEIETQ